MAGNLAAVRDDTIVLFIIPIQAGTVAQYGSGRCKSKKGSLCKFRGSKTERINEKTKLTSPDHMHTYTLFPLCLLILFVHC